METEQQKIVFSAFPLVVASVLFALATHYLLGLYGTVHWKVAGPSTHLSRQVHTLMLNQDADGREIARTISESKTLDEMAKETEDLHEASTILFQKTGVYRYTGWISLGLAVLAFFRKPRWAGWIALPPALYAVFLSAIMM
jgi:hypothetical protein